MLVTPGMRVQYCPDQSHDGRWTPAGKDPATRAIWPFHHFAAAVAAYTQSTETALPDLDFTLEV